MFYKIIEVNKNDITKIIIYVGTYFEYSAEQLNTLYEKDKTNVIFLGIKIMTIKRNSP